MTNTSLNQADIDTLLEACDALQAKAASGFMMKSMLSVMLSRDEEQAKQRLREEDERFKREELARRRQTDDIYLLRAKLIQMRRDLDSSDAERVLEDAAR